MKQEKINFQKYRTNLKKRIDSFDADFLLCEILKVEMADLLIIDFINQKQLKKIEKCVKKIKNDIPLDIIFKKKMFFANTFYVNKNVLTPRYGSELLVEEALKLCHSNSNLLDLCCGSGCLGLSIKKHNNNVSLTLSDISNKALRVCKKNAKLLDVDAKIVKSDLFNNITDKFDMIISNPPYIETKTIKTLEKKVQKYDPKLALDGGEDGLTFYKLIEQNINNFLKQNGYLIIEIGKGQKDDVVNIFCKNFVVKNVVKDYNGIDRVIIFQLK